jgi:hypothetical protein
MSDWQPIETAPKDGREILVKLGSLECAVSFRAHSRSDECSQHQLSLGPCWRSMTGFPIKPTHWMPLPEPPQ